MKTNTQHLLRSFLLALLAVVAALLSMVAATFAWYIYNTSARTTRVEMAAGSSVTLQIANSADGPWGSSTVMEEFTGKLVPVSTDSILGGFQRVTEFETVPASGGASRLIANAFQSGVPSVHYYKTSLFLRSRSKDLNIYLSNIGFEDDSTEDPISTAMRLGLVVQGKEYIFEINQAHNPGADDNAAKEPEGGYVPTRRRKPWIKNRRVPLCFLRRWLCLPCAFCWRGQPTPGSPSTPTPRWFPWRRAFPTAT